MNFIAYPKRHEIEQLLQQRLPKHEHSSIPVYGYFISFIYNWNNSASFNRYKKIKEWMDLMISAKFHRRKFTASLCRIDNPEIANDILVLAWRSLNKMLKAATGRVSKLADQLIEENNECSQGNSLFVRYLVENELRESYGTNDIELIDDAYLEEELRSIIHEVIKKYDINDHDIDHNPLFNEFQVYLETERIGEDRFLLEQCNNIYQAKDSDWNYYTSEEFNKLLNESFKKTTAFRGLRKLLNQYDVYFQEHPNAPDAEHKFVDRLGEVIKQKSFPFNMTADVSMAARYVYFVLTEEQEIIPSNLSIEKGALIYDVLNIYGYVGPKNDGLTDKDLAKQKYDLVKRHFRLDDEGVYKRIV